MADVRADRCAWYPFRAPSSRFPWHHELAEGDADSRRGSGIGLLVTAALIVLGLILVKVLGDAGRLQDCVLSGRTNCAPLDR
jgi:hypothetical protein